VIWWTDKIHTEVFTFNLLTIAWCSLPAFPVVAGVALGFAAAQNPPISIVLLLAAAGGLVARLPKRQMLLGFGLGLLIVATHPIYYWSRVGRLTPLSAATFNK
jgi:hypothetical protein